MCGIVGLFLEKQGAGAAAWRADRAHARSDERARPRQRRLCGLWRGRRRRRSSSPCGPTAKPHAHLADSFTARFGMPASLVRREQPCRACRPRRCWKPMCGLAGRRISRHPSGRRRHAHGALQGCRPARRCRRRASALPAMRGTHAIGHTRMATESSVTTDGAHPFSTGMDQCLVHNGSLSNHNAVRRDAAPRRPVASKPKMIPKSRPAISPGGCAKAPA